MEKSMTSVVVAEIAGGVAVAVLLQSWGHQVELCPGCLGRQQKV
jgi:hypothetical protein